MEEKLYVLYEKAARFDEGELYQGRAYAKVVRERGQIRRSLEGHLSPVLYRLLDAYADTFFDEMELEAMHFFQEGYRAAEKAH